MDTPFLDLLNSPWAYVVGLSLPMGLAMAFWLMISIGRESKENDK